LSTSCTRWVIPAGGVAFSAIRVSFPSGAGKQARRLSHHSTSPRGLMQNPLSVLPKDRARADEPRPRGSGTLPFISRSPALAGHLFTPARFRSGLVTTLARLRSRVISSHPLASARGSLTTPLADARGSSFPPPLASARGSLRHPLPDGRGSSGSSPRTYQQEPTGYLQVVGAGIGEYHEWTLDKGGSCMLGLRLVLKAVGS